MTHDTSWRMEVIAHKPHVHLGNMCLLPLWSSHVQSLFKVFTMSPFSPFITFMIRILAIRILLNQDLKTDFYKMSVNKNMMQNM